MAFSHRGGDRSQQFLLPPSLDDWLPEDHLARFVAAAVDHLDLRRFARPHRPDGKGRRSYDPKMLVALVLLAWCEGVRSSRRIERCCIDTISFRWVTGNEAPDHSTISRFVKDRAEAIDELFIQVLRLALAAGMVKVGVVSVDGTKIDADASPLQSKSRQWLADEVRRIREEHIANDDADDGAHGDARGDEMPGDIADPATRDARIAETLQQIEADDAQARMVWEARQAQRDPAKGGRPARPPDPTDRKGNITDPDCRTMRGPRGFGPGYNAQAAVSEDQFVVATDVTQDRADNAQFEPMTRAVADNLDWLGSDQPDAFVADAGYWSPEIFDSTDGPEVLVPPPGGRGRRKLATRGPIPKDATLAQRMERKLATNAAKTTYRKRAITVEPVFGQMKTVGGMTRFRRRGLHAARSEWTLAATAHNLRKMWTAGVRLA